MPAIRTAMKTVKYQFIAPYTQTGVQQLIQWLMDTQGIGQFELSKRSGLSPATVFQILNRSEKDVTRPPRKSTISSLASAVGSKVHFHSEKGTFAIYQDVELPETESKELTLLYSEIGSWILTRRKTLKKEEREQIVRVVKAMLG